ncbi:ImmA/IrrE family metallo-endopeptidase [Apibacter mensalis]|uniref:ImmA/IrrE family metallo-endopeptidase n=1 Tax=Apibacter mensalis TaxID=1586267 RepID=UPI0026F2B2A2|nr:ImmA/IrrE family metallo-endopeptidase [Apibacter mensalis]
MGKKIDNINKNMIEWAIKRSGYSTEDFYLKFPKVKEWIKGQKLPTLKQLENFTHKVNVPFGYLFLDFPPNENLPMPFFRTGKNKATKVSLNVYHTIQIIQDRQEWLTGYLNENDFPDLKFVGKFNVKSDYLEIVNDIRLTLNLKNNWASKQKDWEEALNVLINQIEDAGVIVTFNGIVGNNTTRKIDVSECRGFVLVNKKAPFLFINASDAKAAQMFTLIHELAHVWLGESAGFNNQNMIPSNDPIEVLCDKVAAEFLVPELPFKKKWETTNDYRELSRFFKVSQIVIGRRALDLNLITKKVFFSFYNNYVQEINDKKTQSSGGNFYVTAKKRVSLRFASFVNNAVNENKLLYRDAYRLTNLKGNTYSKFISKHLY